MNNIEIMGVLNITDNSFHDGGKYNSFKESLQHAKEMIHEGADIIDIGAESSKPGSEPVSSKVQIKKIEPVVEAIREISDIPLSIDTRSSDVIKQLTKYRINIVNDISALQDMELVNVIKDNNLIVSLMHMQGVPKNMQDNPSYDDVVCEVREGLAESASMLNDNGVDNSRIIGDPGIGFGKLLEHNLSLLSAGRDVLPSEDMGLMWGVSRKSMFSDLLGRKSTSERLAGTLGIASQARGLGVDIIRVHDVAEHADLFAAIESLRR